MLTIADKLGSLRSELPPHVRLVAVSKNQSVQTILEAYARGQRAFGENRVQELILKAPQLPLDIEWHFIGHLQTNKVKQVVSYAAVIQSVDSRRLLQEINKEASKAGKDMQCFLQFHIAEEDTKYGFTLQEADEMLQDLKPDLTSHVIITGIMGMATFTSDEIQVAREFSHLHQTFLHLQERFFKDQPTFSTISMGMSDDYRIAIREGSNLVRIGSRIFG